MKSNQKLFIMIWLRKSKSTKDGMAPLYARITIDGIYEEISISQKIDPKLWDTSLKRINDQSTEGRKVNLKIAQSENDIDRHFTVLQTQHENVTAAMLKKACQCNSKKEIKNRELQAELDKNKTLLYAFWEFIAKFQKQVEKGKRSKETLKHWNSARSKIEIFLAFEYKMIDIDLLDIRFSFAQKFYDYMTLELEKPIAEITARGYVKKLKQILKECVTNDLIPKNPIQEFSCTDGEKDVEPLEMYQVQALINKSLPNERLAKVRDAFVFQIFTGFAFQDIYALNPDNIIKVGNSGELWLIKDRGENRCDRNGSDFTNHSKAYRAI